MKEMLIRLSRLFARVSDWLLIVIGVALMVKALLAIDVPLARYMVLGIGAVFVGLGFRYRHRRNKRCR